jgi:hypothetical protein
MKTTMMTATRIFGNRRAALGGSGNDEHLSWHFMITYVGRRLGIGEHSLTVMMTDDITSIMGWHGLKINGDLDGLFDFLQSSTFAGFAPLIYLLTYNSSLFENRESESYLVSSSFKA